MRSDRVYLLDILDPIRDVDRYRPATRESFDADERTQVWTVHRLKIDPEIIWPVISERLPALKVQVEGVLTTDALIEDPD